MRTASDGDLTTRARIRNAAIAQFGRDGFGVGLRAIAADAGVSPALVLHHFGSKAGLREACDEHVLTVVRQNKSAAVSAAGVESVLAQLAHLDDYAVLVAYVIASLADGGPFARALVDQMVSDAEDYLAHGVANGTVRPSRDPAARARFLVMCSVGVLLLHHRLYQAGPDAGGSSDGTAAGRDPDGRPSPERLLQAVSELTTVPALELYTEGLLTDSTLLDAVLDARTTATHHRATGEPR